MGIYDREYYRREGPSILGSFTERGKMCKWLVFINVVCFITQVLTRTEEGFGWFTESLWLNSAAVLDGQVWRLLTYAFLHDPVSPWHILFNMLFLWWFGSDVEDLYGPREFLAVYLMSALLGGIAFLLYSMNGGLHMLGGAPPALGASGAVTAVLVLCAIHFPSRVIYVWFLIPLPLWIFVLIQVGQDLYGLTNPQHHVAVAAHLGGAAFAYVYYKRHWRLLTAWSDLRAWVRQLFRPRLRVYREAPPEPVAVEPQSADADVDEHLEAKLDAVLAKVARFGKSSLTESEHQILMRASEVYKRRRT